ncbi:TRAP transporter small permease subunit [Microbacterium sp. No. 7]|uniref:TRAP transporter small permease subunit n=1 Tax=Microbacterium sp. No. 7 TaxID=1714373 RepID=UPI0006CFBB34|nr:TRAP transporter small permease [Microbacterium sp. No. 7]ALJ20856.1 hypothetical protein AOA12_13455 [Microbacterium sp. No. 7]
MKPATSAAESPALGGPTTGVSSFGGIVGVIFNAIHFVSRVAARVSGGITAALMLLIVVSVVKRATTGIALPLMVQLVEIGLVSLVALGLAHTWQTRSHVGIDLFVNMLGPRMRALLKTISSIVVLALCIYLINWLVPEVFRSIGRSETIGMASERALFWPARAAIAFGFVWLALEVLISTVTSARELIDALRRPRGDSAEEVAAHG